MGVKIKYKKGDKVGYLTYHSEPEFVSGKPRFINAICECGRIFKTRHGDVRHLKVKTCGCSHQRVLLERNTKHSDATRKNKHYLYSVWGGIKKRCYNKKEPGYKNYGWRGIKMYEPWINDYLMFKNYILSNLGERPEGHSLDRIDNDGNYEPGNLRWADRVTQNTNQRPKTFSEIDVYMIRNLIKANFVQRRIAEMYKTTPSTICDINKKRIYNFNMK